MNLYVGNLLFNVTDSDLREAFEPFGEITEIRMIMDKFTGKSKGFGFIEMPSNEDAQKAISEMNGKEFMGRDITVSVAKPKTTRPSGGGGGGGRGRPGGGRPGGGGRSGGGRPGGNRSSGNRSDGNRSDSRY
jgi:RNA recognition motif-containing protein